MNIERLTLDQWADALPSGGFDVFHTPEALRVLDDHAPGTMTLLGGFKGQQSVALFPAFVRKRSVGRAVTSPPPSMSVPHMGPIINPNSPKQRKREKLNRKFARGVLDELDASSAQTLFRVVTTPGYGDPRPFDWADLSVEPGFTYRLHLDGRSLDDVMSSFSSSLRRDIRKAKESDAEISVEGVTAARTVFDRMVNRYDENDDTLPITWPFMRDLVDALDDRCRVYVVRTPDGEFLSGIVTLFSNDTAYFWQGGARADYDGVSVNSLLHWAIIEDIVEDPELDSVHQYDLVGANTERLCKYKAKFGAQLHPYYVVESAGPSMEIAKRAYQLVKQ
ncbi:GNAT family N-acetyltransferase [Halostella sp. PRR32]|uniref:GNAT family N-acetyltransferase n=1 Tax=Halostella sp. PRR32 TaxID=3098147 RepID=UPI002B1D5219|nr:GNAT family N-acetyltransferase [Halostella sp. PRR32]